MKNLTIDAMFESARTAVNNTQQHPELRKRMGLYGFPPKRIQEGSVLLEQAQALHSEKDDQYFEWWNLSDTINRDKQAALDLFRDHVKVVKVAFRQEPATLQKLGINRIKSERSWSWTSQAHRFYTLLEEYGTPLAQFGISAEELQQAKAGLDALLAMKDRRKAKKGQAEHATQVRNQTFLELRTWLVDFRASARLAFKDAPQLLETYEIKVNS